MTKTAFAIAAHPDDIEFLMSGTLMRLAHAGYEIHYMNVADGCCGSTQHPPEEIARIRRGEAMAAAASIGAVFHENIAHDLEIFYDRPTLAKVAAVMREVNPQIVLTHAPVDYMEDHTNTCRLAVSGAFTRGMPNFPTDPAREAASGGVTVYHAQPYGNRDPLCNIVRPDFVVDVTGLIDRKTDMLSRHRSQKIWLDKSQGLDSYLDAMKCLSAEVAEIAGADVQFAEGWRRHLHLGFCNADDDPLREALGDFVR